MPESSKAYFSAFKSYLEMKFMDRGVIPVFQRNTWSKLLNALVTSKQRMHYKNNVALSNPKEMISEQHQDGISKLCIWNRDTDSASFLAFNSSLFHHAARSVETAGIRKSQMLMKDMKSIPTLTNIVNRSKISKYGDEVRTYPHKESMFLCYHFALAYSLIINSGKNSGNDFIFPEFEKYINYHDTDEDKNSVETKASALFARYADAFVKMSEKYGHYVKIVDSDYEVDDEEMEFVIAIPRRVRAHSGKKGAVNELSEKLEVQYFAFRCG